MDAPRIDNRSAKEIYRQSIAAARVFCPDWATDWPENPDHFNAGDNGMVILKLLSRMTESLLSELNRAPDKYKTAFYDLLGINLLPSVAATVPLTFIPAKGTKGAFVEKGTRVALGDNDKIIYETSEPLSVTPLKISEAISFNPWADNYCVHKDIDTVGDVNHSVFAGDPGEKKCPHSLFIRHDLLFKVAEPADIHIHITFEGAASAEPYLPLFQNWKFNGNVLPLKEQQVVAADSTGNAKLINILTLSPLEVEDEDEIQNLSIEVSPSEDYDFTTVADYSKNPAIQKVELLQAAESLHLDHAYINKSPLDLLKGGYPFSTQPARRDAFYLGSSLLFSKAGSTITLQVTCDAVKIKNPLVLQWEYWNSKTWEPFSVTDTTNNFKQSGKITFVCPNIMENKTNGKKSYWIRARIDSGDYGTEAWTENKPTPVELVGVDDAGNLVKKTETINQVIYHSATYDPPYITSIIAHYSFEGVAPQESFTENYGEKEEIDLTKPFEPFRLKSLENPGFYFGCYEDFGGQPLSLFFPFQKRLYNEPLFSVKKPLDPGAEIPEKVNPVFEWQYFDGTHWKKFDRIEDTTNCLLEQGYVKIIIPQEQRQTGMFGMNRYWFRLQLVKGDEFEAPRIKGIFPNTVRSFNKVVIKEENLGSSNGKPEQSFEFSKKPILPGQQIEVIEPQKPTEEEEIELSRILGINPLRKLHTEESTNRSCAVTWIEVEDFTLSLSSSRHYRLDRTNGRIYFGDGQNGMIPPLPAKGTANIIAAYSAGGGSQGNAPPLSVKALKKAVPNIESVVNYTDAAGGFDQESLKTLLQRAPHTLRTKDRAVTAEDYEWLVKEADPIVYRSKCLSDQQGRIIVIILPKSEEKMPIPTAQTIKLIGDFLQNKSLFVLENFIRVTGPQYVTIDAEVIFKPVEIGETPIVQERIQKQIEIFFHPVFGNIDSKGWDFGEDVFSSDLSTKLEEIAGVDYIVSIVLREAASSQEVTGIGKITIQEDAIVACGRLSVSPG